MESTDFRVQQTYDEIQQMVRNAAESILSPPREEMDAQGEEWAEETAERIAEATMHHMDGLEVRDGYQTVFEITERAAGDSPPHRLNNRDAEIWRQGRDAAVEFIREEMAFMRKGWEVVERV